MEIITIEVNGVKYEDYLEIIKVDKNRIKCLSMINIIKTAACFTQEVKTR